jgi:hypothetical protein
VCANLLPQNTFQRIDVRNASDGTPVTEVPLAVGCTSGTNEEPQPAGVWAYTPRGAGVSIPR